MDDVPLLELGPLRARVVGDATGQTKQIVVLLHGYGAPGADLVGYARRVQVPAGTRFVLPESPHLLDDLALLNLTDDARVWWAKDARSRQQALGIDSPRARAIPEDKAPARIAVSAMLDSLVERLGVSSEHIVLGGFSQGAVLAVDVVLKDERPFAGLVLLSGLGPTGTEERALMSRRRGMRVFQAHGTKDSAVPFAAASALRDARLGAAMDVTFTAFDGDHGIPPEVIAALGEWLTPR